MYRVFIKKNYFFKVESFSRIMQFYKVIPILLEIENQFPHYRPRRIALRNFF